MHLPIFELNLLPGFYTIEMKNSLVDTENN